MWDTIKAKDLTKVRPLGEHDMNATIIEGAQLFDN